MKNWIPQKFLKIENLICCQWLYLSEQNFDLPFFEETILHCLHHPNNSSYFKTITPITDLPNIAASIPYVPPSAFIFHTSRCGSTLMTQLLSKIEGNIVVSEYPAIDDLLRMHFKYPDIIRSEQLEWLKATIQLIGQKRIGVEKKMIIKLDSWHLFYLSELKLMYPEIPFIIMFREPRMSIASHKKSPGMQAIPNLLEPEIFGFDQLKIERTSIHNYLELLYHKMYDKILFECKTHSDILLLNYNEGGQKMIEKVLSVLRINPTIKQEVSIFERLKYHSKKPQEAFSEVENFIEIDHKIISAYLDLENFRQMRHPQAS